MPTIEKTNEMNWVSAPEPIVYEPTAPPLAEIIEYENIPYAEVVVELDQSEWNEEITVEYCVAVPME